MSPVKLHFGEMATRWNLVGPPLRPSPADVVVFEAALPRRSVRALVLGVTPELHDMAWPEGSHVMALDASEAMVREVWPGTHASARIGEWTQPPFEPASFDCVVCDGGIGLLAPKEQVMLIRAVGRLLDDGGRFVVRLFAPQGRTGTLIDIEKDLAAGRVSSLDALKLRLWGALQQSAQAGVRPRDVVAWIDRATTQGSELVTGLGWSGEHVAALQAHRDSGARYHLVDAPAWAELAYRNGPFEHVWTRQPAHEWGACCPVVTLERQSPLRRSKERSPT